MKHAVRPLFVERHAHLRVVLGDETERKLPHHFEAREPRAEMAMRHAEQPDGSFERWHRGPRRERRGGQRIELHGCGRDDAERAFAADEQIAQVVARVVLAQT